MAHFVLLSLNALADKAKLVGVIVGGVVESLRGSSRRSNNCQ
jgi:hypothetical protein